MEKLPINEVLLQFLCLLIIISVCSSNAHLTDCLASDREALMDFKTGLQDPRNLLSSWKGSNCCQWRGIHCDNNTRAVVGINLHNPYPYAIWDYDSSSRYAFRSLSGDIRPSLMKLKSLRHLDLSFNTFHDIPIPEFFGSLKNLQYLNLSNAGFRGTIPPNLGNLSHLKVLDLEIHSLDVENLQWITGLISLEHLAMNEVNLSLVMDWVGKLNQLPSIIELHLSRCWLRGYIPSLTSLNFTSLATVDFSDNSLGAIPDWLLNVSSLQYIDMSYNNLHGRIPLGLGELPNLLLLDLSGNVNLTASCSQLFEKRWEKIQILHLAHNNVYGKLPSSLGNITSLIQFDLSFNAIEGGIPSSIGKLCNLNYFDLSTNNMRGSLPESLEGTESCPFRNSLPNMEILDLSYNQLVGKIPNWLGQLKNLVTLDLNNNLFEGPIPTSLGSLQNLTSLRLQENKLNETLPNSLGELSALSDFDVSSNQLTGIVSETHFSKLTKLRHLDLSSNSLIVNVSSNWMPPFQVQDLQMGSCILGPSFPAWLKTQKEVELLDFSNANISGSIPNWFWIMSFDLSFINISHNELQGQLLNPRVQQFTILDLSFNILEGPIPYTIIGIELLDLSHNHFSGPFPQNLSDTILPLTFLSLSHNHLSGQMPKSIGEICTLHIMDLSNNNFTGRIPSSLANCSFLMALDLSSNSLFGAIPNSLGLLPRLQTMHLSNNQLTGKLPSSFVNLSKLETMDLGNNGFSGKIPTWIGDGFSHLRILNLRSNAFFGEIPFELSKLRSLQVLDLGENDLSGNVPASFGDLQAMVEEKKVNKYLRYGWINFTSAYNRDDRNQSPLYNYDESLVVNAKGQSLLYTKTLSLVTCIDLSGNNLFGRFPQEITRLSGLVILNLSRNHITGNIPGSISNMHQLSSLDLSSNQLTGTIPPSLSSLSFLGYLNLSYNNLSGAIPYIGHMTTFDASSFVGNPGLYGCPLTLTCLGDDDPSHGSNKRASNNETDDDGFIDKWFYLSLGLGFAGGLLVPYFILAIKRSWSDAYFDFVDIIVHKLIVLIRRRRINHGHRIKLRH